MINGNSQDGRFEQHDVGPLLERCATLITGMARLPAVPTPDWCHQAARTLLCVSRDARAGVGIVRAGEGGRLVQMAAAGVASTEAGPAGDGTNRFRILIEQMVVHRCVCGSGLGPGTEGAPISGVLTRADIAAGLAPWAKCMQGLSTIGGDPPGVVWASVLLTPSDRTVGLFSLLVPASAQELTEHNRILLQTGTATLAKLALHAIQSTSRGEPSGRVGEVHWLTPREQDVLELLVEGKSVREISDELSRSPHTVHDYVKSLHRKLGASSRGELVARVLGHVRSESGAGGAG